MRACTWRRARQSCTKMLSTFFFRQRTYKKKSNFASAQGTPMGHQWRFLAGLSEWQGIVSAAHLSLGEKDPARLLAAFNVVREVALGSWLGVGQGLEMWAKQEVALGLQRSERKKNRYHRLGDHCIKRDAVAKKVHIFTRWPDMQEARVGSAETASTPSPGRQTRSRCRTPVPPRRIRRMI